MIARQQALGLGLAADALETLLRTGRWQRMQRGVYAVFTGEPRYEALLWAVLLRVGSDAVLSHQTAAELFGLAGHSGHPIHVTVPRDSQPGRIPGVIVHRAGRAREARHPVMLPPRTKVEETVLDLAASARSFDEAFDWFCRATGRRLTTPDRLRHAMHQRTRMRWRPALLESLETVEEGVRSNLEYHYVREVERPHELPRAARQARVIRYGRACYLDNYYEKYLVCVELDGKVAHPPEERWRDFRRDNAGAVDGIITLRYGWADITRRPCEAAGQVAAVLRQRGWNGTGQPCGPSCWLR